MSAVDQLSRSSLRGQQISSNPCITEAETIKRQTRAACEWRDCLVAGQSSWARAHPAAYRLYARSVCDTTAPLQLQYAACGAKRPFRCAAPSVWNSLPASVIGSDSLSAFKSRLKTC